MFAPLAFLALSAPLPCQTSPLPAPPRLALEPRVEIRDLPYSLPIYDLGSTIGRNVLFTVSESAMNQDLNDDGDMFDPVLHRLEVDSWTVTNLGVVPVGTALFDPDQPRHVLLTVREDQPAGNDRNGDGDSLDSVFVHLDLATGLLRDSGLAAGYAIVSGGWAALHVEESSQGNQDLDGNGFLSRTAFAWNLESAEAPIGLGLPVPSVQPAAHDGTLLFNAYEGTTTGDLNGDGDLQDWVLQAFTVQDRQLHNTQLATNQPFGAGADAAFTVPEAGEGHDLNGDGDLLDQVQFVRDGASGIVVNLELATGVPIISTGHGYIQPVARSMDESAIAFHVPEKGQGVGSLNGDPDKTDHVLFVHEFSSGTTRNVGYAAWQLLVQDGWLVFEAREGTQEADLNGDGDLGDLVAQVMEVSTGELWNTGFVTSGISSSFPFSGHGRWLTLSVRETTDLNGDGDTSDLVLVAVDARNRRVVSSGLAHTPIGPTHNAPAVTVRANEQFNGADLNGDGDLLDGVLHLFLPARDLVLNTGASTLSVLAPVDWSFPFVAAESDDGRDWNGDGDAQDRVLRIATLKWH